MTFRALAFVRANGEIVRCVYMQKMEYAIGGNVVTRKKKTLVEWKAFFDTVGFKRADL